MGGVRWLCQGEYTHRGYGIPVDTDTGADMDTHTGYVAMGVTARGEPGRIYTWWE